MAEKKSPGAGAAGRVFHARLDHPEPRIYRATYRGDVNATHSDAPAVVDGPQVLPDSHIGTDREGVIAFVEAMALQHGYDRVAWEEQAP
jgi:hypothetical protein